MPLGFPETGKESTDMEVEGQEVGRLRFFQLCVFLSPGISAHFIQSRLWAHRESLGKLSRVCTPWDEGSRSIKESEKRQQA